MKINLSCQLSRHDFPSLPGALKAFDKKSTFCLRRRGGSTNKLKAVPRRLSQAHNCGGSRALHPWPAQKHSPCWASHSLLAALALEGNSHLCKLHSGSSQSAAAPHKLHRNSMYSLCAAPEPPGSRLCFSRWLFHQGL